MNNLIFITISVVYISALSLVDGIFNRLVFRENRKLSYFSKVKQEIYKMWEWKAIGVILLIVLPIILPLIISYLIGGAHLVLLYIIILCLVPWDIIFGKLVFDDWLGDTSSIALPFFGWKHISLNKTMVIRIFSAIILFLLL